MEVIKVDVNEAIRLYETGKSMQEVARELGVSKGTLNRRVKAAGYKLRPRGMTRSLAIYEGYLNSFPDLTPFVRRYEAGEGFIKLAKEAGIPYRTFRRRLDELGVQMRTTGERLDIMYSKMTKAERAELTKAANKAKRGSRATIYGLECRARTMESTLKLAGASDLLLAVWIAQTGYTEFTLQKAVGIYNIDIALDKLLVAVEVNGFHHLPKIRALSRSRSTPSERRNYLLNGGWSLIEVVIDSPERVLKPSCADRVITLAEEASAGKSSWGQHCMIRGDGEFLSRSEAEVYYRA